MIHRRNIAVLCTAMALIAIGCGSKTAQPEDTVRGFVDAVNAKDAKKAATFVVGGQPDGGALGQAIAMLPPLTLGSLSVSTKGDEATATMTLSGTGMQNEKCTIQLSRVGGAWKIVPDSESKQSLPSIASFATKKDLAEAMRPVFEAAKQRALATQCQSNLSQIAKAMFMYVADMNGVFAIDASKVMEQTRDYVANDRLWQCGFKKDGKQDYSFNASLRGVKISKVKDPKNTVMLYEGDKGKLEFRHDGIANVAFVDTHVERVGEERSKTLKWNP